MVLVTLKRFYICGLLSKKSSEIKIRKRKKDYLPGDPSEYGTILFHLMLLHFIVRRQVMKSIFKTCISFFPDVSCGVILVWLVGWLEGRASSVGFWGVLRSHKTNFLMTPDLP